MALEDYKDIVAAAAGFVTFCQMFSGVFLCKDIYKMGSTNKVPLMPFMGGFVISTLFYQHALLIKNPVINLVNLGGMVLNFCYLLFYFLWTEENKKSEFYRDIGKGMTLIFALLLYVQIENPEKVGFRFGMMVTILLMVLIASPLFSLGEIIRTKSTEKLPFPMIVSNFVVSGHWLLYGITTKNNFLTFQNVVGFSLCLIQLSLFFIFPTKAKKEKTK